MEKVAVQEKGKVREFPKNGPEEHWVTPNELMGEIQPALMDMMGERTSGPVGVALAKNWKYFQNCHKRVQEENRKKLREHCELDENDDPKFSVKEGDRNLSPDFKSVADKEAYQKWYVQFAGEREFGLLVHKIRESDIKRLASVRPASLAQLEFMIHSDDE